MTMQRSDPTMTASRRRRGFWCGGGRQHRAGGKGVGLGVDEDELIGEVLGENDDVAGDGGKERR